MCRIRRGRGTRRERTGSARERKNRVELKDGCEGGREGREDEKSM